MVDDTVLNDHEHEPLRRPWAKAAAWVSLAGAAAGAAALLACRLARPDMGGVASLMLVGWMVLLALVAGGAMALLAGKVLAQRALLAFWLAALVVVVVGGLGAALGMDLSWLGPARIVWPVGLGTGALAAGAAALLVKASGARSRQRYGSLAMVSAALAIALVVVANLIAQKDYWRGDLEVLGRYGLSSRAKAVLKTVTGPVRLSCAYSGGEDPRQTSRQRQRVLELMREMAEEHGELEVADASSDAARAGLLGRLRTHLADQARQHAELVEAFRKASPELVNEFRGGAEALSSLPRDSFLAGWGQMAGLPALLDKQAQQLEQLQQDLNKGLCLSSLPDYGKLADRIRTTLHQLQAQLQQARTSLEQIALVPAAVQANQAKAMAALENLSQQVAGINAPASASAPAAAASQPAGQLEALAQRATGAAQSAKQAGAVLMNLAGTERAQLLATSHAMQMIVPAGPFQVRTNLPAFLAQDLAEPLERIAQDARMLQQAATAEYQRQALVRLGEELKGVQALVQQVVQAGREAIAELSTVDPLSAQMMHDGGVPAGPAEQVASWLKRAEALPELKAAGLGEEVAGRNIVVIEAAGKIRVVGYDKVFPLRATPFDDTSLDRIFNGESAITSALLAMTHPPFARVLLTHLPAAPGMGMMAPRPDFDAADLSTLRQRLEDANFEVDQWDLSQDRPAPQADRPDVLMPLPPAPAIPMPQAMAGFFGPEHLAKVRQAINEGAPAIFLAQFSPPRQMGMFAGPLQMPYGYDEYLRQDWGIRVMSDYLVIPAVSDQATAGVYRIDPQRFTYLPLNTFSDQPIGRPLQAQRTLWTALCPVVPAQPNVEGLTLRGVLGIPADWHDTWATRRIRELLAQFTGGQDSQIKPDFEAGDLAPPFDVVLAASREGGDGIAPARVVVMGAAAGLLDGYLDQRVMVQDDRGTLRLTDPPSANADLVINSVYWLIGRQQLIAAGPATLKPVAMIPARTLSLLWAAVVLGLPAAVVAIGAIVLLARRR